MDAVKALEKVDPVKASELRDAIRNLYNSKGNSTATSRAMAVLNKAISVKSGNFNPSKTNAAVNSAGKIAEIGGTVAVGTQVLVSTVNVVTADNKTKTLTVEGSGTLGSIAGAKLGALG